jgi:hypothetical protein
MVAYILNYERVEVGLAVPGADHACVLNEAARLTTFGQTSAVQASALAKHMARQETHHRLDAVIRDGERPKGLHDRARLLSASLRHFVTLLMEHSGGRQRNRPHYTAACTL